MRTPLLASLLGAIFVTSMALLTLVSLVGEASAQAAQYIWLVTTSEDPGPDECGVVCSLRAAISAANESDGPDLIRFDIGGSTTISLLRPLPALNDDAIEIDGRTQRGWLSGRPPVIYLDGRRAGPNAAGIIVTAADAEIRGLGIGGFARYGIGVLGAAALRAVVEANWIGMSADGRSAASNRLSGVAVLGGAADAHIGGPCEGCGNRIAGNSSPEQTGHGVVIGGGGTTGALVVGNVIGLDRDDAALPNDDGVLVVDAAQAEVRGNVICASRVAGVEVRETGVPSSIDDNWIGVTRSGVASETMWESSSARARRGSRLVRGSETWSPEIGSASQWSRARARCRSAITGSDSCPRRPSGRRAADAESGKRHLGDRGSGGGAAGRESGARRRARHRGGGRRHDPHQHAAQCGGVAG